MLPSTPSNSPTRQFSARAISNPTLLKAPSLEIDSWEIPLRPAPPVILNGTTCGRTCWINQWNKAGAGAWVNKRRGAAPRAPPSRTPNALAQCLSRTSKACFQPIRAGVSRREELHLEGKNEGSKETDVSTNQKLVLLREWAGTTSHLSQ